MGKKKTSKKSGKMEMKSKQNQNARQLTKENIICIVAFCLICAVMGFSLLYAEVFEGFINQKYYENESMLSQSDLVFNEDDLKISFVSVGCADATVIELPDDKIMLIDCADTGDSKDKLLEYLSSKIFIEGKSKTIDYLIITHPDNDHFGGAVDVLNEYDVKNIYRPKTLSNDEKTRYDNDGVTTVEDGFFVKTTTTFNNVVKAMEQEIAGGAIMNYNETGIVISSDLGAVSPYTFTFLSPDKDNYGTASKPTPNDYSAVLLLEYKSNQFLFMGDATGVTEDEVIDNANRLHKSLNSTVLKVAHHGSKSNGSNSQNFLSLVAPVYAIISVENESKYDLPKDEVINRLESCNVASNCILRTDLQGTIQVGIAEDNSVIIKGVNPAVFISWFYVVWTVIVLAFIIFIGKVISNCKKML